MPPTVVITHRVHDATLALLSPHCQLITNQSVATLPREEVLARLQRADAMMAFMPDRVDAALLDACPRLKVVAGALKGFDNFDVAACSERGVWLTFVPDLLTVPTAELAVGLTIGLIRHVRPADQRVRSGDFRGWLPEFYGLGIDGSRIGILGMGAIGKAIAQRLHGWGATMLYTDQSRAASADEERFGLCWRDLETLLAEAQILLLALPLTPETLHLINAERLALCRPGAFLVNPCRGSVVDERAVLAALRSGRLGGYAADVFEMEDWARPDRPDGIEPALLIEPRTLFTPHLGSAVREVRQAIERCAAHNILQALAGERPANAVNDIQPSGQPGIHPAVHSKQGPAC